MAQLTVQLSEQDRKKLKILSIEQDVNMPDLAAFAISRLAEDIQNPEVADALKAWLTTQKRGKSTQSA